jgi:hypothetical protein
MAQVVNRERGDWKPLATPKGVDQVASGRQRDRQRRSEEAAAAQARRDHSEKTVPATMRTVGSQTGMPKDGRRGRASQDPRYR